MSEQFKCAHGVSGGENVVVECNKRLQTQINDALEVLRTTCAWRTGDGYYVSECLTISGVKHSHSASVEPERWKFCPYCGNSIPHPLFPVDDDDEVDPHG